MALPGSRGACLTPAQWLKILSKLEREPLSLHEYDGATDVNAYLAQVYLIFRYHNVDRVDRAAELAGALRGAACGVLQDVAATRITDRSHHYCHVGGDVGDLRR